MPGERPVLMEAPREAGPGLRVAVLNCFEDTLPGVTRPVMRELPRVPNLLVNVTNDAWFSGTRESELHLRLAVLRAIEARRDLVRAVNLGVTSWVDASAFALSRASPDVVVTSPAVSAAPSAFAAG